MGLDMYLDIRKKGTDTIVAEVGYWRKANHIHNWFVDNVQNGEDDCGIYVVEKDKLHELLTICQKVIDSSELIDGLIKNGQIIKNGKWEDNWEKGKTIKDTTVASELLPTVEGFFFGSTGYDEWYIDDIKDTIEYINLALNSTDFENEEVVYSSSW